MRAQWTYFRFTTQELSMVGGYMENLKKPQNCQNWRSALAWVWALALDNTALLTVIVVMTKTGKRDKPICQIAN